MVDDCAQALSLAEPQGLISIFIENGLETVTVIKRLLKTKRLSTLQTAHAKKILAAFPPSGPAAQVQSQTTSPEIQAFIIQSGSPDLLPLVEPLTSREVEVLTLMSRGLKYQEIADQLFISLNTVRFYVKAIYSKLNVNNRTQALEIARQYKII